jgi:integrase
LVALHWEDVDLEKRRLTIRHNYSAFHLTTPKSRKSARTIPLPRSAVDVLRARLLRRSPDTPLVFPGPKGRWFAMKLFLGRNFYPALDAVGLPRMGFHKLRHIYDSLLIQTGADASIVMTNMGHASLNLSFGTYMHRSEQRRDEFADALDTMLARPVH